MTDDDGDNCRLAFVLLDFPAWIAGAMTTSISILIVNEGGNNRSAAVLVGIFVLVRPSLHLFFCAPSLVGWLGGCVLCVRWLRISSSPHHLTTQLSCTVVVN